MHQNNFSKAQRLQIKLKIAVAAGKQYLVHILPYHTLLHSTPCTIHAHLTTPYSRLNTHTRITSSYLLHHFTPPMCHSTQSGYLLLLLSILRTYPLSHTLARTYTLSHTVIPIGRSVQNMSTFTHNYLPFI